MHRFKLRLAVAALTFVIGVSVHSHLLWRLDHQRDCYCVTYTCRVLFVADNPLNSLMHPWEAIKLLAPMD
ncbi:MAG TPA: hypothetical protein VF666_14060 [Pyrinomonadaceae bacterium]|jgi:hypothetical protein